jgi:hypothetical protein
MDEEDELLQSLVIQYLLAHTQCSGCGRSFGADDMHIRARRGSVWLAAVTCSHCGLQGLIMAAIKTSDAGDSEPTLEADAGERVHSPQREPISSDEVLDWHCFLEQFHGDVHELLGERKGPERP